MLKNGLNIVVADDDKDDQSMIKDAFDKQDVQSNLTQVFNGQELLNILGSCSDDQKKPDLVILDLNMPIMNGVTALAKLKKIKDCKSIPVYVLSTSSHESDRQTCSLLGAKKFLTKPNKFSDLQKLIKDILTAETPNSPSLC